jgi:hypothetical protein
MHTTSAPVNAFASVIGPREVAHLARALPWLETSELARILLTATPATSRTVL